MMKHTQTRDQLLAELKAVRTELTEERGRIIVLRNQLFDADAEAATAHAAHAVVARIVRANIHMLALLCGTLGIDIVAEARGGPKPAEPVKQEEAKPNAG